MMPYNVNENPSEHVFMEIGRGQFSLFLAQVSEEMGRGIVAPH